MRLHIIYVSIRWSAQVVEGKFKTVISANYYQFRLPFRQVVIVQAREEIWVYIAVVTETYIKYISNLNNHVPPRETARNRLRDEDMLKVFRLGPCYRTNHHYVRTLATFISALINEHERERRERDR